MSENVGERLFGTDGIRGTAGEFPLDERTVAIIGQSIVRNLANQLGCAPRIVIGRDTRESGPEIESALSRGAIGAGATVQSAGVITTPGVAYITRARALDVGVVISASHNPYQDNGIKVFSPSGRKLADEMERRIEADVYSTIGSTNQIDDVLTGDLPQLPEKSEESFKDLYINYLANDVGRGLSLEGLRIALDCANGAASGIAPVVFGRLGADIQVLSARPNGRNINQDCGSLHLENLHRAVIEQRLDLGIAFDGDADRALFIDANGGFVDGDVTLLILADYLKQRGALAGDLVISTVMSNIGFEIALRERGIELVRAQVGDRFVLEELLTRGAKLGGEQSGHIIFPDIALAGDGIITAIELLRAVKASGSRLERLAAQMKRYPQVLLNVRVRIKPPFDTLPEVKDEIDRLETELVGRGRLLVRYSGTENLARVMIEGEDETRIKEQANRLSQVLKNAIGE